MSDHKLDRLEKEVGSLSAGQQELHKELQREMRSSQEMMRKHMDEMFAAMNTRLDYVAASVGDQGGGSSSHNKGGKFQGFRHEQGGSTIPKVAKLDFPRYNGDEDPTSWVCRVEQFFEFKNVEEEEKVPLAAYHLEGEAQLWYQLVRENENHLTWVALKEGLFLSILLQVITLFTK
jgi:hypothetical protein